MQKAYFRKRCSAETIISGASKKVEVTPEEEKEHSDDDDCYEIDAPDFTKKLSLEVSDNEVVLVAANGPVALRDFPHPRHLCGNLPFSSTPHEKHCKQCYCTVCEIPAPCSKWNDRIDEHCNASKKLKKEIYGTSHIWEQMRRESLFAFK